jgi:hypothetical protein
MRDLNEDFEDIFGDDDEEINVSSDLIETKLITIMMATEHMIKLLETETYVPECLSNKIAMAEEYVLELEAYIDEKQDEMVDQFADNLLNNEDYDNDLSDPDEDSENDYEEEPAYGASFGESVRSYLKTKL